MALLEWKTRPAMFHQILCIWNFLLKFFDRTQIEMMMEWRPGFSLKYQVLTVVTIINIILSNSPALIRSWREKQRRMKENIKLPLWLRPTSPPWWPGWWGRTCGRPSARWREPGGTSPCPSPRYPNTTVSLVVRSGRFRNPTNTSILGMFYKNDVRAVWRVSRV